MKSHQMFTADDTMWLYSTIIASCGDYIYHISAIYGFIGEYLLTNKRNLLLKD